MATILTGISHDYSIRILAKAAGELQRTVTQLQRENAALRLEVRELTIQLTGTRFRKAKGAGQ